jgi:hypothetical protein
VTRGDWNTLVAEIVAYWPAIDLSDATVNAWFRDVQDLDAGEVAVALAAFARDGREFPPNGGQIRAKAKSLATREELDHGAAWRLAMDAVTRFGSYREDEALMWLAERSVICAEAVRRFGFRDLCMHEIGDVATVRAQFREIFRAVRAAAERDERYSGLPGVRQKRLQPRTVREIVGEARKQIEARK